MVRHRQVNVVDSASWLTYLADAPGSDAFAEAIEAPDFPVVPAITIVEVFKVVLRDRGESEALQAAALMQQGTVVSADAPSPWRWGGSGWITSSRWPTASSTRLRRRLTRCPGRRTSTLTDCQAASTARCASSAAPIEAQRSNYE